MARSDLSVHPKKYKQSNGAATRFYVEPAVWIRTKEATGVIRLSAKHPTLGAKTVEIRVGRPEGLIEI